MTASLLLRVGFYLTFLVILCITKILGCPVNCTCDPQLNTLSIDCELRASNYTDDSIETEINAMLVQINQLNRLVIRNTKLKSLPMEVCNSKSLISLYIAHNQFDRLPDNCFTRLQNLTHLIADYNNLEQLQVRNYLNIINV